jgi:glycerol-1-phosphate dehydrogenase [NAD(P)+]
MTAIKRAISMDINSSVYDGPCGCGRDHKVATRRLVIDRGCLARLDRLVDECGLEGPRVGIYDTNTYRVIGAGRPAMAKEIVLDAEGLHADEKAVETVMRSLGGEKATLFAFGSGTVTDVARYCAGLAELDFVSCPTAASVDGFCSSVAAMSLGGFKKTVRSRAPLLVIADLDIIARAPVRLTRSGIGDLIGKYVSLADWRIANVVTGEAVCDRIVGLLSGAVEEVRAAAPRALTGEPEAFECLVRGLLLSGLAMQMNGDSRPASGAEHHLSHLLELGVPALGPHCDALHGEKVGVGTILVSRLYHAMALAGDTVPLLHGYEPLDEAWVLEAFGGRIGPSIIEENKDDCLLSVSAGRLRESWPAIQKIIAAIPGPDELLELYGRLGMASSLPDIGVDPSLEGRLLGMAPCIRNRLTLARMRRLMNIGGGRCR